MHTESAPARAFMHSAPARVGVDRGRKSVSGRGIVAGIVLTYAVCGLAFFMVWQAVAMALAIIF
jgi:hypothetical protein